MIVIEGKSVQEIEAEDQARWQQMSLEEHMEHYESQGNSRKEAMKLVAKDRGFRSGMCTRRCWRRKRRRHKQKAEKWISGVALVECRALRFVQIKEK